MHLLWGGAESLSSLELRRQSTRQQEQSSLGKQELLLVRLSGRIRAHCQWFLRRQLAPAGMTDACLGSAPQREREKQQIPPPPSSSCSCCQTWAPDDEDEITDD